MVLGNVQRHEVVVFVLDFRAGSHVKAHAAEDLDQVVYRLGNNVLAAQSWWQARLGYVNVRLVGADAVV